MIIIFIDDQQQQFEMYYYNIFIIVPMNQTFQVNQQNYSNEQLYDHQSKKKFLSHQIHLLTSNNFVSNPMSKGFFDVHHKEQLPSNKITQSESSNKELDWQNLSYLRQIRRRNRKDKNLTLSPQNVNPERKEAFNPLKHLQLLNQNSSQVQILRISEYQNISGGYQIKEFEIKKQQSQVNQIIQNNFEELQNVPQLEGNFLFQDEHEPQEQNQQVQPIFKIPSHQIAIQDENQLNEIIQIKSKQIYFQNSNQIKLGLYEPIKKNHLLYMQLVRDKSGLNSFWPQFYLKFDNQSNFLISAKKTASKPYTTFILSLNCFNFQQNSPSYLGKLKSNILGDVLNLYGPGFNPSKAKEYKTVPRQLLATIVYQSSFFQVGKPREFNIYIKKQEYQYYKDFEQIRMYGEQIPLSELYAKNHSKIIMLNNKKPVWTEQLSGYMLNFHGRVGCPSIKNFILQQSGNEENEVQLFGKVNDHNFNMNLSYPMSIVVGFSIALSTFDSRIMCQ